MRLQFYWWTWDQRRLYRQGFNWGQSMLFATLLFSCRGMVRHWVQCEGRIIAAVIKVAKGATNLFLEVEQNEHFVFHVLQKGYRQPIRKHDQKHLFPSRWRIYLSGIQDAPYIWNYEGTRTEGTEQTSSTLQNLVHRIWKSHVNNQCKHFTTKIHASFTKRGQQTN